jgi:transcriptional antiterminator Rof (Rho-off)
VRGESHNLGCAIQTLFDSTFANSTINLNLKLRQLKVFIGHAQTCNFTKTAQKLHISQAALSSSIRELKTERIFALSFSELSNYSAQ